MISITITTTTVDLDLADPLTDPPDDSRRARREDERAVKDGAEDVVLWERREQVRVQVRVRRFRWSCLSVVSVVDSRGGSRRRRRGRELQLRIYTLHGKTYI